MSLTLLLLFGVFTLFGVPLAIALGLASVFTLLLFTDIPLSIVAQSMLSSMNSFLMVAVPMFILAGLLMDEGGVGEKIFDFANALVGWLPGGLGHVNVVSSVVFAGMSGSALADIASIGLTEISAMTRHGYPKTYATALTLLTSTLATIIPPSILMVIAGSVANESIGRLLVAGLVPGLLIAAAFMVYNHIYCLRNGCGKRTPFDLRTAYLRTLAAVPALFAPAILMYGIVGGFFTPTEAASIAVLYTMLVVFLVYRKLSLRQLPGFFFRTAKLTGTILFIAVTAKMAAWIFTYDALPAKIATFLTQVSPNPTVIMLLSVLFFVVVGMFMDATASLFLLIPILLPAVRVVGIDPIHFLVVMVISLSLGLATPPVGVALFAVSNLTGLRLEEVTRGSLGLFAIYAAVIVLIALVPQIVLVPLQWIGI